MSESNKTYTLQDFYKTRSENTKGHGDRAKRFQCADVPDGSAEDGRGGRLSRGEECGATMPLLLNPVDTCGVGAGSVLTIRCAFFFFPLCSVFSITDQTPSASQFCFISEKAATQ